jgi:hypothetical protein
MNISRRLVITIFILLVILFVGMLNWPFVLNEIVMPISLVIWLFLRILVLSIDQQYYWVALIFAILIFLCRLIPQDQPAISSVEVISENETINSVKTWYRLFLPGENNTHDQINIKREFTRMIVQLYAIKLHTPADYKLLDSLRSGDITLPEHIHAYLFPIAAKKKKSAFLGWISNLKGAPRRWIRQVTGQEKAEQYKMINDVLGFLETSLEMKNDDRKFNPNQH